MKHSALLQQALDCHREGDLTQAQIHYENLLKKEPCHADGLHLLGVLKHQLGDLGVAEKLIRRALMEKPKSAVYYHNLGNVLKDNHQLAQAIKLYEKSLQLNPTHTEIYNDLAVALKDQGKYTRAIGCIKKLLKLQPQHAIAYNNLANIYKAQDQIENAISAYQQAIKLQVQYVDAYCNLGNLQLDCLQYEQAITTFKQGLLQQPQHMGCHLSLAVAYENMGQWQRAMECYNAALQIHDNTALRVNRAYLALALADFHMGWADYELRFAPIQGNNQHWSRTPVSNNSIGKTRWQGQCLDNACLYVYSEQGIGDEIMFAQTFPTLAQQAKRLIIACDPRLIAMFSRSFPTIRFVDQQTYDHSNDNIDYEIPMGSICQQMYQQLEDFPQPQQYLHSDKALQALWQQHLAALGEGRKIGISWRGGLDKHARIRRSTQLEQWLPLLRTTHCHFINLQYGDYQASLQNIENTHGIHIHHWDAIDPLKEIENFSALISQLDLIISIDNSTVHFAGSLGIPTWVLLPLYADWRWLTQGESSYWYASLKLLRQKSPHQWEDIFKQAQLALS